MGTIISVRLKRTKSNPLTTMKRILTYITAPVWFPVGLAIGVLALVMVVIAFNCKGTS